MRSKRTRTGSRARGGLAVAITIALLVALGGCGVPGDDGRTYLAIDWSSAPEALYFPAFPQTIYAGEYVEHEAGSYEGEYVAWDGTYWEADYWIEVDPGGDAPLFGTGDHGDDYYLSLWLWSFGPEIYTDEIESRAAASGADGDPTRLAKENDVVPPEIVAARERVATGEPIEVRESRRVGNYVVTVSARAYR